MLSFFKRFFKQKPLITKQDILKVSLPPHIGIIMDGNGRWARRKGLPRAAGHRAGAETLRTVVETCIDLGYSLFNGICFFHRELEKTGRRSKCIDGAFSRIYR